MLQLNGLQNCIVHVCMFGSLCLTLLHILAKAFVANSLDIY